VNIEIYKKNQGKITRSATFLAITAIALIGASQLSDQLSGMAVYWQYGIPTVVLVAIAAVTFYMVNRPKSADFLIATEGEMKKVSWSSKKEVFGSTKVVIVTAFILASLLFTVDQVFRLLLGRHVLGITEF
jgi:preprotein translocase subunit SecE